MGLAVPKSRGTASTAPIHEVDIEVSGLTKSFEPGVRVLDDVSLNIAKGESVALLGHNGSGKSTFLRCSLRLIEPDVGRVVLLQEPVTEIGRRRLRKLRSQVGFVFQHHNLVRRLSVLSNVLHGALSRSHNPRLWFHGLAPRLERERAMHSLEQVGLAHLAGRRADQLSGGQSQRVAIARTLMQDPQILMADEPVASLDPQAGQDVMELLYNLSRDREITLVFSSHHLDHALEYADRILVLKGGKLIKDARAEDESTESLRGMYE